MVDYNLLSEVHTEHGDSKFDISTISPGMTEHITGFVNSVVKRRLGKLDSYTVLDYLKSTKVSQVSILTALVFIEKFANTQPAPDLLEHITAIDLFVVALMTASKYLHDVGTADDLLNTDWAELLDRDLADLNQLEIRFLTALDWNCFVGIAEYRKVAESVCGGDLSLRCGSSLSKRLGGCLYRGRRVMGQKTRTTARFLALLTAAYLTSSAQETIYLANQPAVNCPIRIPEQDCVNSRIQGYPNDTISYPTVASTHPLIEYYLQTVPSECQIPPHFYPPNNTPLVCVACGG